MSALPVESRDHIAAALAVETLARTGQLRLRANGASMLPALRPGDELEFLAPVDTVDPGDIVLWRRDGRLVIHRVLDRQGDRIVTQGDALPRPDAALEMTQVLGKLTGCHRAGLRLQLRRPGLLDRCRGWIFRRSETATRLFLHWHGLTRRVAA